MITSITSDDRGGDGSIKPEIRERSISEVQSYLIKLGYVNISDISRQLGLARQHARSVVLEAIDRWREEEVNSTLVRIKWLEGLLKELEDNPQKFTPDYIRTIGLKLGLMDRIDSLKRIQYPDPSIKFVKNEVHLWENLKPKTIEMLKEYQKKALDQ